MYQWSGEVKRDSGKTKKCVGCANYIISSSSFPFYIISSSSSFLYIVGGGSLRGGSTYNSYHKTPLPHTYNS